VKRALLIFISITYFLSAKAQKSDTLKGAAADTLIFSTVEQPPQFHGGLKKFYRFLVETVRYPAVARENNTQGEVVISMIVEKDGSLSHLKVTHSVSKELDREALRVMNLSPKWDPGMQNGHIVRVYYDVPITFTLAD
jgi:periplasmic protein TonB